MAHGKKMVKKNMSQPAVGSKSRLAGRSKSGTMKERTSNSGGRGYYGGGNSKGKMKY